MTSALTFYLLAVSVVICSLIGVCARQDRRNIKRLPPGPKPLPIVGNLTSLPASGQPEYRHWLTFKDAWGPISSISVLGKTLVLIHSASIATELLEKRASIYSERPEMFFASQMVGWDSHISFQGNNATMRSYRRDMHGLVGTKTAVDRYSSLQDAESRRFLVSTAKDPKGWEAYLKKVSATIILSMSFGYRVSPRGEDPMVTLIEQAMADFSDSTAAGKWLVDILPWIRHLPEWMPGMQFKKIARGYRRVSEAATEIPMKFAEDRLAEGRNRPCMVADLLGGKVNPSPEEHQRIKISATDLYLAGSDTTFAALRWFFFAMCLNPAVQHKAQEELDRVVGIDRLPGFADRDNLPYIEAIWKETLRWNTVAPLSIPHAAKQDDEFQGYLIPKGAIVIPNTWWFLNDPSIYRDPEAFRPERFLGEVPEPAPDTMGAFGYGRRVCTGRALAEQTGWLVIAETLSVFNIAATWDEATARRAVRPGTAGIIHHPQPFEPRITLRSDAARELLLGRVDGELCWEDGDAQFVNVSLPPVG